MWQRIAERRARIGRENRKPSSHGIILVQSMAFFGKWVATVNGAGFVASIALMVAAYTSLAGASNMCVASGFVSHTVGFAQDAAIMFAVGGILSIVVFATLGLIGFWRNLRRAKGHRPPLLAGQDLQSLSNLIVGGILTVQTCLLALCITKLTIPALHPAFDLHLYTQEHIQTMWRGFEDGCKPTPPSPPDMT